MEHTDFNNKSNPLFDDPRFKCQTRKGGHASEFNAGDKATVTLKDDLRAVLELVKVCDGRTAKVLGTAYAMQGRGLHTISITTGVIRDIVRRADLPHKKMSKLVELGLVRIEERPGGNRNWITDAGKAGMKRKHCMSTIFTMNSMLILGTMKTKHSLFYVRIAMKLSRN